MDWKAAGTLGLVAGGLILAGVLITQGPAPEQTASEPTAEAEPRDAAAGVAEAPAQTAANAGSLSEAQLNAGTNPHSSLPQSKFVQFQVGNRNVKDIHAAQEGVVWIGTSGGVVRYDRPADDYRHYDVRNGLLANGVFYVGELNDRIAVGTYGGGLALLNEASGEWKIYNIPEGLGDAFVYDALQLDNGDIWIATWTGVNRIDGGRLDDPEAWEVHTVESTSGGLPNDWVYGLAKGQDNDLWLATEGGLAHYEYADQSWEHWTHAEGLGAPYEAVEAQNSFMRDPADYSSHHARQKQEQGLQNVTTAYNPNYIVSLSVAPNGQVWAGTWGGGLSRYDGEHWTTFTAADGLPSNHVFMLHHDPQGQLWVGTSHGLAKRTDEGFKVYTREDGLFANSVFSMETPADGSLWIGSFGGVARITELN